MPTRPRPLPIPASRRPRPGSALTTRPAAAAEQLDPIVRLVLDGLTSPESRRSYAAALRHFLAWCSGARPRRRLSKATVQEYRAELLAAGTSASTVNIRLAAIRKLAAEASDNGLLIPELAAGVARVPGVRREGVRLGNWLTLDQAQALLELPAAASLKGKRDRALLAVLLGCGLRRRELADLHFEAIAQREGRWAVVDLIGKGGRVRTVPMPAWAKSAIDAWATAAALSAGRIFRPVNKGDALAGEGMTPQAVFLTVKSYAMRLGVEMAPHDLRRTFAKLAHRGRAPVEQIQLSLGHASIQTTERYLGVRQDLADAPCDRLGLKLETRDDAD